MKNRKRHERMGIHARKVAVSVGQALEDPAEALGVLVMAFGTLAAVYSDSSDVKDAHSFFDDTYDHGRELARSVFDQTLEFAKGVADGLK